MDAFFFIIFQVRSFAHVRGNWATYAYLSLAAESGALLAARRRLREALSGQSAHMHDVEDFHVSLTRTVALRHHWINDFTTSLGALAARIQPVKVKIRGHKVLVNEEGTRTFVCLEVEDVGGHALSLTSALDAVLAEYGLPAFYRPAVFHASLLWTLGDRQGLLTDALRQRESELTFEACSAPIRSLECKIGNKMFSFSLGGPVSKRHTTHTYQ